MFTFYARDCVMHGHLQSMMWLVDLWTQYRNNFLSANEKHISLRPFMPSTFCRYCTACEITFLLLDTLIDHETLSYS